MNTLFADTNASPLFQTMPNPDPPIVSSTLISDVWAGHPVGFDFLVSGRRQYATFYDGERRMTVATRARDGEWSLVRLQGAMRPAHQPKGAEECTTKLGWDTHNGVVLGVDAAGCLHLSGNMHNHPLVYFRTRVPHDISSFERIDRMTGELESACTYPVFLLRPDGNLVFRYRTGISGNGADYYNIYDHESRTWRRLLDRPLLDGLGSMSPYSMRPVPGPDGRFHMVYCWRDTPDVATNHDLCYMRSRDLVHWENAAGQALELPSVFGCPTVVDPIPAGGGLLNARQRIGFDAALRPIISYTKFDEAGMTQAYCARFENGSGDSSHGPRAGGSQPGSLLQAARRARLAGASEAIADHTEKSCLRVESGRWKIRQASNWNYRWELSGWGSIPNGNDILLEPATLEADGTLRLAFQHIREGSGAWQIDPETLAVRKILKPRNSWPPDLARAVSDFPGMHARILPARGQNGPPKYMLRWETLAENRDEPREKWPPPSELRCYQLDATPAG
jgi:hypothetical protein